MILLKTTYDSEEQVRVEYSVSGELLSRLEKIMQENTDGQAVMCISIRGPEEEKRFIGTIFRDNVTKVDSYVSFWHWRLKTPGTYFIHAFLLFIKKQDDAVSWMEWMEKDTSGTWRKELSTLLDTPEQVLGRAVTSLMTPEWLLERRMLDGGLELRIGQQNPGTPNVLVGWCITPHLKAKLQKRNIRDPHIVFFVLKDGKELYRDIAPLKQGIHYIPFSKAGVHTILATVMWKEPFVNTPLRSRVLKKWNMLSYEHEFVNAELEELHVVDGTHNRLGEAKTTVEVAGGFFASEPRPWVKKWVNCWHDLPARDECQFKERMLIAFGIKWMPALLWLVYIVLVRSILCMGAFLYGARGINYQPMFHPFSMYTWEILDAMRSNNDSVFLTNTEGKRRSPIFWATMPLIPTSVFLSVIIISGIQTWMEYIEAIHWGLCIEITIIAWILLLLIACISVLVSILIVLFLMASWIVIGTFARLFWGTTEERKQYKELEHKKQITRIDRYYENEINPILCSTDTPQLVRFDALPQKKQTFKIRYLDMKARVCRMYQA